MYASGEGVSRDDKEAFKWYKKAADNGDVKAQNIIGIFYSEGIGVSKDSDKSLKYLNKSSESGSSHSQLLFACSYFFPQ